MDVCLNLGCGDWLAKSNGKQKWVNLDLTQHDGVDIVADLEDGLPFPSESADYINLSHVLEHIRNYVPLLMECYRVLKPGGILHIKVPHAFCRAAIADPTHVNQFVEESFYHFARTEYFGFKTLKLPHEFTLGWLETVRHPRPTIDGGIPGSYFTEILVDLEKPCPNAPLFFGEQQP